MLKIKFRIFAFQLILRNERDVLWAVEGNTMKVIERIYYLDKQKDVMGPPDIKVIIVV